MLCHTTKPKQNLLLPYKEVNVMTLKTNVKTLVTSYDT